MDPVHFRLEAVHAHEPPPRLAVRRASPQLGLGLQVSRLSAAVHQLAHGGGSSSQPRPFVNSLFLGRNKLARRWGVASAPRPTLGDPPLAARLRVCGTWTTLSLRYCVPWTCCTALGCHARCRSDAPELSRGLTYRSSREAGRQCDDRAGWAACQCRERAVTRPGEANAGAVSPAGSVRRRLNGTVLAGVV